MSFQESGERTASASISQRGDLFPEQLNYAIQQPTKFLSGSTSFTMED